MTEPDYYSVADAAKKIGLSTDYIRARMKDGSLPYAELATGGKTGKRRIHKDHLAKFMQDRTITMKPRRAG